MADTDWFQAATAPDGTVAGWASLRCWTEQDGVHVCLTGGRVRPADRRRGLGGRLLDATEAAAARIAADRGLTGPVMLGGNADDGDVGRTALLLGRGYERIFTMVLMEHDGSPVPARPLPDGVTVRPATTGDARALHRLTARVWAGRPFFEPRDEKRLAGWLRRSDLSRFQVATVGERLVGFVAVAADRIEDVQVDPDLRRRGLASAMVTRALGTIGGPARLWTEEHDPAGARTLYERLGFRITVRAHRYRKPLR
ncbi:GNAT family N-acetyltransferase [Actinoplanes sp. NPDC049802]|uniref:GNAT family N-acetyltransferase n=1 Tax=Actinoplanes sp. NPDC049802 TaxID=3154742 RepID=UPI0033CD5894